MSNDHDHSANPSSPDSTTVVTEQLTIIKNSDGTITRVQQIPTKPATSDPTSSSPVLSKDIPLNPQHETFARLFLHRKALDKSESSPAAKLPLVVYIHGGGFIICSPSTVIFHEFCEEIAIQTGVMVVSVGYRLSPEHHLPAAYDDVVEALRWIRTSDDEWLRECADLSKCFLMGASAGGNIAYHVGLRVAAAVDEFSPLEIRGLVLHQPFFGGLERTSSELRLIDDPILPLFLTDVMWELSLPIGADRNHGYCNASMVSGESEEAIDQIRSRGWKVMVTGCDGDPLIDRQTELVKVLEKRGVAVVGLFEEGGGHGSQLLIDSKQAKVFSEIFSG